MSDVSGGQIAPLGNAVLFSELMERVIGRRSGLPGLATFHGPSGYGKTRAAIWSANRTRAYYVQIKSLWTRKALCQAILKEMGIGKPAASSDAPIISIGEEGLPLKLKAWERAHGRMLDWVAAQPATLKDCQALVKLYAKGIEVSDDLLAAILEASAGSVRRVCVNLDRRKIMNYSEKFEGIWAAYPKRRAPLGPIPWRVTIIPTKG